MEHCEARDSPELLESVRDVIFLLLLLSLMREAGRKSLIEERKKIAGFQNSESGALSQRDFGFSLCAVPEFQV